MSRFKFVVVLQSVVTDRSFVAAASHPGTDEFRQYVRYGSRRSEYDNNFFSTEDQFVTSLVSAINGDKKRGEELVEVRLEIVRNGELEVHNLTKVFNALSEITPTFVKKFLNL